ncbi:uncharacterized protein BDZ83DRAFT_609802 [Colletotrichum acutatum]|uniref:Uncharacterized protein n=1 Tax=Glomerella acutata TaxID=27357 RepID=A0AAD8UPN9_GLOAC|nr:uncharacterized protein BDZ83DRAFT_609802 [Colletotrichum acutatum]KAK1728297.1 hypothetical protein BDZ83DRAFT_609802 [Colletotrichum acutatum]
MLKFFAARTAPTRRTCEYLEENHPSQTAWRRHPATQYLSSLAEQANPVPVEAPSPQKKELQRQNNPRHTHGDKTVAITSSFSTPLQPDRATLRITTSYNGRLPFRPLLSRPCRCVAVPLDDPCRVHRHSPPPPAALKAPSLSHHARSQAPNTPPFCLCRRLNPRLLRHIGWESGKGPNPIDTTKPPKSNQKGQRGHPSLCNWS